MKITRQVKRKIIQIAAFGFSNTRIGNFASGRIYTGSWKNFCNPGLNCYSCPAANFACPLGALQAVASSPHRKLSFYALGFLLAVGVVFGRAVCGFFCPFGLLQELLNRVPLRNRKLPYWMTYIKYAVLIVFVFLMPVVLVNYIGAGSPAFCKYICPAGTLAGGIPLISTHPELQAMLGKLFSLKLAILIVVLIACLFVHRFFCKTLCPLGAFYGILNKVSILRLHVDPDRCVECGSCSRSCPMDVDPVSHPASAECIRCGKCVDACHKDALRLAMRSRQS